MPHNFVVDPKTDLDIQSNVRVLSKTLDSDIYLLTAHARSWVVDTVLTGAVIESTGGRVHARFPNANDSVMRYMVRRHDRWRNGILKMRTIWYTSTTTGNNFFGDLFRIRTYREGSVFGTPVSDTGVVSITMPGPATTVELMRMDLVDRNDLFVPVNTGIDWINIQINRDGPNGSDTNNGDWEFIGLDLEYVETTHIHSEKYNNPPVW